MVWASGWGWASEWGASERCVNSVCICKLAAPHCVPAIPYGAITSPTCTMNRLPQCMQTSTVVWGSVRVE